MLISDIPVGGPISIEISIDNVSYEMPSSVVASKNGYILIAPFTSKGAVIDFSSYKDILFNLYTIDPATKNRVVWKNINIETITYKSTGFASAYYKISTNVYASIASECDRRFNQRISTGASGHISSDTTEADIPVTLIDVSDKGLSFSTSNELLYNYNNTYITFSDQANGKQFNFHFKCFMANATFMDVLSQLRPANILHMFFLKKLNPESVLLRNSLNRPLLKMLLTLLHNLLKALRQDIIHTYLKRISVDIRGISQCDMPLYY